MVAFWVFASVLSAVTVSGQNLFGQNFIGDGTFYGNQGDQSSGNCAFGVTGAATLPWTTGLTGPKFLALASPLYNLGPSTNCGLCIAYYGDPVDAGCTTCGTTPIPQTVTYAMVSNQCPECLTGSLDQASNGDGRFKIDWHAVCLSLWSRPGEGPTWPYCLRQAKAAGWCDGRLVAVHRHLAGQKLPRA